MSFLVVAIPHTVPCPAPRVQFADSELEVRGNPQGMKERTVRAELDPSKNTVEIRDLPVSEEEVAAMQKAAHECPVPKPYGAIRKILGFSTSDTAQVQPSPKNATTNIEVRRRP